MIDALVWTNEVANVILGVIMIARMYQRSRKVLMILVVIFLAIRIAIVVIVVMLMTQASRRNFFSSPSISDTLAMREI
jgi:hypothetical protein